MSGKKIDLKKLLHNSIKYENVGNENLHRHMVMLLICGRGLLKLKALFPVLFLARDKPKREIPMMFHHRLTYIH